MTYIQTLEGDVATNHTLLSTRILKLRIRSGTRGKNNLNVSMARVVVNMIHFKSRTLQKPVQ